MGDCDASLWAGGGSKKTHRNLKVWKSSMGFVVELYKKVESFYKKDRFGSISQLQRAAASVPNISFRLGYLKENGCHNLRGYLVDFSKMLNGLIGSLTKTPPC
ncbi:MAG: four helix bundle protein [Nitrospirota bacterium]